MKTAIVYVSTHHGNTLKLARAIAHRHDVTLIDAAITPTPDLSGYDRIGFASGAAYGGLYKRIGEVIQTSLPAGKAVFFLYTCGRNDKDYAARAKALCTEKGCTVLGHYGCLGYDTFGPLALIGGINKGHPDQREIEDAVAFFDGLSASD